MSRSRAKAREAKYAGPIVDGVQYPVGYTQEAAEYEERTKMIHINIDDKPRPSWIETDQQERLYEQVKERARLLGFNGMAAGWKLKPTVVGEMVVIDSALDHTRIEIRVEDTTPMRAVEAMGVLLSRLER